MLSISELSCRKLVLLSWCLCFSCLSCFSSLCHTKIQSNWSELVSVLSKGKFGHSSPQLLLYTHSKADVKQRWTTQKSGAHIQKMNRCHSCSLFILMKSISSEFFCHFSCQSYNFISSRKVKECQRVMVPATAALCIIHGALDRNSRHHLCLEEKSKESKRNKEHNRKRDALVMSWHTDTQGKGKSIII